MNESRHPAGWNAERVKKLIDHYEGMSEDEQVADDESAMADKSGQVVVTIPKELVPAVRELITTHRSA